MKNISVDALINDYCTYNEYRDTILSFLGSVSFGDVPYSEIERYCNKSEVEDDLFYFFDSVRYEREMTVIDHLANLSFSELGKFYIDNHDALSFLKPMFQVSIVDELPDWDYPDVKMIRNCFFDTDFYPEIDSIYQLKRDVAIEKMMEDLDDYFTSENQYIESIRQYSLAMVDEYIYYVADTITETCRYKTEKNGFAKVFKHKQGDFMSLTKFAAEQVEEKLNFDTIKYITVSNIGTFLINSQLYRNSFLDKYQLNDVECFYSYNAINQAKNNFKDYQPPLDDVKKIQNRKIAEKTIEYSMDIVGLFLGGIPDLIVTAVDVVGESALSIKHDKKNEESFEQFRENIYQSSKVKAESYVNALFDKLYGLNNSTQEIFRYKVAEAL